MVSKAKLAAAGTAFLLAVAAAWVLTSRRDPRSQYPVGWADSRAQPAPAQGTEPPVEERLEPPRRVLGRVPGQGDYAPSLPDRREASASRRLMRPVKASLTPGAFSIGSAPQSAVPRPSAPVPRPAGPEPSAAAVPAPAGRAPAPPSAARSAAGGRGTPAAPAAADASSGAIADESPAPGASQPPPGQAAQDVRADRSSDAPAPSGGTAGGAPSAGGAKPADAPRVGASGPVSSGEGGGSASGGGSEGASSDSDFAASLGAGRSGFSPRSPEGSAAAGQDVLTQQASPVVSPVRAAQGEVSAEKAKRTGGLFSSDRNGQPSIQVYRLETQGANQPVAFTADMDIDADGAGGAWKGDRTGQSQTSLRYSTGESLNPSALPFVVIPLDFPKLFPDVGLGDYSAVSYKGKTVYGIVGDFGPRGVVGEASINMAASLGINPDPNRGGTGGGVNYVLFPKTRDPEPPRDAQAIQQRGAQILQEHGLGLK